MANKQIEWELKFPFPWARLNVGGCTRHLGGIYSLWDLGAEWRPWVLQVQWGATKGSLGGSELCLEILTACFFFNSIPDNRP